MTKENDFTLQELELIAAQLPLIPRNSAVMQKINAKIKDMQPKTIRIGEFDVPEPLRECPKDGVSVFVVFLSGEPECVELTWIGASSQNMLKLHRGLLHKTRDDAVLHARALISLTESCVLP